MARSCYILTDYDAANACHSRSEPCANAELVREASGVATLSSGPPHLAKDYETFRKECPWQESNPWGFVLRVICVTIKQSYNRGSYNRGCTIA